MVKRFYNNEDDDEQFQFEDDTFEENSEEEEEEEGEISYVSSDNLVDMMHMDLAQTELNQHLLTKAIDIAKHSFFWRFRSITAKMKEIKKIYKDLAEMTEEEKEEK